MLKGFKKGETSYPKLNDKEWLYQKYVIKRWSTVKIENHLGCANPTVWRALKKFKIPTRTFSEAWEGRVVSIETRGKQAITRTKFTPAQHKLNRDMATVVRRSLKGAKKGQHWETLVGYTSKELMITLEKGFRDGMTWANHGILWHIDHIIPLAHFHYDSPEDPEFKKAWALNNLQPLFVSENLKKGTKFMFF